MVDDGSSLLNVTFFNQAWREKQLAVGTEVSLFGKLDVYRGKRQMTMPVVDVLGRAGVADDKTGVILPVYPQSGKAEVFTWQLRALVGEALAKCRARGFADPVDPAMIEAHELVDRNVAMRAIHRPESMSEQRDAYRRLVFDEFLRMQVGLVARKRALAAEESGIRHTVDGPLVAAFLAQLPFALTGDQRARHRRDHPDMAGAAPMHRLLQGDVGSGKTVVALAALLVAVQGGYQGAFMAPTEVLAEQHYLGSVKMLEGLTVSAEGSLLGDRPVRVELLTNRTTAAERRRIAKGLHDNEVDILVGTHALLYGDAEFTNLGFAVIDEQHRFGVEQRALLKAKATGDDRARRARDDRHADPAHGRDARLRRPRQVGAARDAARPHTDRDAGGRRGAARPGRDVEAPPRRGGRRSPGLRRVPARRRQGQGRGQGRDRGVRAPRRPRSSRACGSVSCTGSCLRRRRRR